MPQPDTTTWPTKQEAAERLQVNPRTIDKMIAAGRLQKAQRPNKMMTPFTIIDPASIDEELVRRQLMLKPRAAEPKGIEATRLYPPDTDALLAAVRALLPASPPPLNFELEAAAVYCNLPKRLLLRAIRNDQLRAHLWAGKYYISREDLEHFRPAANVKLAWTNNQ